MDKEFKELQQHSARQSQGLSATFKAVDKLGMLVKGSSKELDNQLATLRKNVKNNAKIEQLVELTDNISATTAQVENTQIMAIKNFRETLLEAGEKLQTSKGMDANVRRKLRMVVNKLKAGVSLFSDLPPLASELISIFQSVSKTKASDVTTGKNNVIKLLVQGIENLAKEDNIVPDMHDYLVKINGASSEKEQVDLCLNTFTLIIDQFSTEFKQTQQLVLSINSALEDAKNALLKSLSNSKSYDKELKLLNIQIDKQIKELSKNADEANSFEQLQSIIDKKLYVITESIKRRDEIEQKRAAELNSTLTHMESKLNQMEERTSFYRGKWLEEKSRSETDALTELPNRRAYDKRFDEEIQRLQRASQPMCLAVIDIDHFKKFNDKYGHAVGDKTLQIVAKSLRKSLRATDYLARYGGEEFACLLIDTDIEKIRKPLEKVRKTIEAIPFVIKKDRLNITISIGVTELQKNDTKESMFERADKALYQAKSNGRNQVVCYLE
ncbi:MAG: diguanylate cyclase [Gammaproteobacteria bacterium]|nr:diguanylate cyclase [Gammaproteobacteria bacterium]